MTPRSHGSKFKFKQWKWLVLNVSSGHQIPSAPPSGQPETIFSLFCIHSKQPEQCGAQDRQHYKVQLFFGILQFPLSGSVYLFLVLPPPLYPTAPSGPRRGSLQYSPTAKLGQPQLESFVLFDWIMDTASPKWSPSFWFCYPSDLLLPTSPEWSF